ncbi:MAG: hypothetical protein AAFU77_16420 [Myxococcota bacterium]
MGQGSSGVNGGGERLPPIEVTGGVDATRAEGTPAAQPPPAQSEPAATLERVAPHPRQGVTPSPLATPRGATVALNQAPASLVSRLDALDLVDAFRAPMLARIRDSDDPAATLTGLQNLLTSRGWSRIDRNTQLLMLGEIAGRDGTDLDAVIAAMRTLADNRAFSDDRVAWPPMRTRLVNRVAMAPELASPLSELVADPRFNGLALLRTQAGEWYGPRLDALDAALDANDASDVEFRRRWLGRGAPVPIEGPTRPETIDVTVVDDSDLVGFLAAAVRSGELGDIHGVRDMVDRVLVELNGRHLGELEIDGHGWSGRQYMGDGEGDPDDPTVLTRALLHDDAIRSHLARLRPFFAESGSVDLGGCVVAHGYEGVALLQELSDLWGVPVQARTGVHNPVYGFHMGEMITRQPGQGLGAVHEEITRQILVELPGAEGLDIEMYNNHAERILMMLEEANRHGQLGDVVNDLEAAGDWSRLLPVYNRRYNDHDFVRRINSLALPGIHAEPIPIEIPFSP